MRPPILRVVTRNRGPAIGTNRLPGHRTLRSRRGTSAHAAAGLTAVVAVLDWFALGAVVGFPDWWETVMAVTSSTITLVTVVATQHTHAVRSWLDGLVHSMPLPTTG